MADIDLYTDYYMNQIGTGIGSVYAGPAYQKGYGVGSFLGGLFRTVYPLLAKGTKAIGSEIFKSGVGLLSDLTREDPDEAFKKRGKEIIQNLSARTSSHLFGKGYAYKGLLPHNRTQSTRKIQRKKKRTTGRRKKKNTKKRFVRKKVVKNKKRKKKSRRSIHDIFA